ncbi:YtpI family protein [Bacillaceae bacterium W0354]
MPIFITVIVVSFVLYFFFKVRILNEKDPLYMHYTNAKARMALGIFIATFGMNQYAFYQTKIALFVCIVFLVLGIAQFVYGYKLWKHYRNEILKTSD